MQLLPPPGPQRTRQLVLLGGLLVVVVWLGWSQFGGTSPAIPPDQASNPQTVAPGAPLGALPEPLRLASLADEGAETSTSRNPFGFGQPPAPPLPPLPPPRPVTPPTPPPAQPQGPPPIPLELVGMWQMEDGRRFVSLRDPVTKATMQAYEGAIVDGRYRLVTIGERSVVMTYLDGAGQRTIPLAGGGLDR
jgi:hypothetical protein